MQVDDADVAPIKKSKAFATFQVSIINSNYIQFSVFIR